MSDNGLDFSDLTRVEVSVTVGDKQYTLREATGDAACRYRNALLKCTELGPEGKPVRVIGMADVEPLLVSLCLFNEQNKPVHVNTVRSWPARIQKALFEKTKEISNLDDEEEDEEAVKNEQSEMTDGSD